MRLAKIALLSLCLLILSPQSARAVDSFFDITYDVSATIRMTVNPELHRPTTLRLQGTMIVRSSEIGDLDGDGRPDIQTEILSMNLTGTTPQGLAINLNSSKSNIYRSRGGAEQLVRSLRLPVGIGGANPPANSFFDVFTELSFDQPPVGITVRGGGDVSNTYFTQDPSRIEGVTKSLTDLSGLYTRRKSISVILYDREGRPVGTISLLAVNLNSSKSN